MKVSHKIVAAVVVLFGIFSWATPSGAEINSFGEKTWGVYGLATGTQTDTIQSQVWAIEQIDDRIYVGGRFLEARKNKTSTGVAQPFLAAFDANTGEFVETFRPAVEGAVYSLQASPDGSRLFVGGEFRSINGDSEARGLAALNPISGEVDRTWRGKTTNTSGARGVVYNLDTDGAHLYAAGRFDTVGGGARPLHSTTGAARFSLTTGEADRSFTVNATGGGVWGIAVAPDSSKVYLAGRHTAVDGNTSGGFYSVLSAADGSLIPSLSNYVANNVGREYGQDVVAVGNLVFWGGSEHIVNVFDANTGQVVRQHSADRGGDFQDLEVVGDRVYASCHCYTNHWADFDYWSAGRPAVENAPAGVNITPLKYVAAYSASTGAYIDSFQLDVSASRAGVWAIHGSPDGCLWVGGDLTRVTVEAGNNRSLGGFAQFCDANAVDSQAPTTPVDLTQTRQEKAKIVLRWGASTDNDEVVDYQILRDGQLVGTKAASQASNYWFTDSGLTEATGYTYEVVAIDAAGNSSDAATFMASTTGVIEPDAPEGLRSTFQSRDRIVLNWEKVPEASAYVVERGTPGGFVTIETRTGRWFTDREVTAGTSYQYRVRTISPEGVISEPSEIISIATLP